jgi:nucleoside-diphosphate-sugar epimerase
MSKNYFVTGALGCIGAWVVKQLVERGDTPIVYDLGTDARRIRDLCSDEEFERVRFVHGDITDLDATKRAVEVAKAQAIVHLAGLQVPFCRQDPALGAKVNVLGTIHLFEAALACGVGRICYASSAAVFGPADDDDAPPDEHAVCEPVTHYGVYKRANEGTARVYWLEKKLPSVGLRPLTVYGVGRDRGMTSGPTTAMKAAVLGRPFAIGFTGATDFNYVADTAAAFVACADAAPANGPDGAFVYNLHGDSVDVAAILAAIEHECPDAKGLITAAGPKLPIPPQLDGSAILAAYPGLPHTDLQVGIGETVRRFRELRDGGSLDRSDLPQA